MTPALSDKLAANVLRLTTFTKEGKKTTAEPIPVLRPAIQTNPKAMGTFSLVFTILMEGVAFVLCVIDRKGHKLESIE